MAKKKKTFDELVNDYLKQKGIDKRMKRILDDLKRSRRKVDDSNEDKILSIIEDFKNGEVNEEKFFETLGKPDKIRFYNEGDLFYEERSWDSPEGTIVNTIISDEPTLPKQRKMAKKKRDLNAELERALESEDYETAVILRDLIAKETEVKKDSK